MFSLVSGALDVQFCLDPCSLGGEEKGVSKYCCALFSLNVPCLDSEPSSLEAEAFKQEGMSIIQPVMLVGYSDGYNEFPLK